jgi:hypothetical protein
MTTVSDFVPGGYSFLPSVFQYSAGVAALPGYEIQRVRFRNPLPLGDGFDFVEKFIRAAGRPIAAFCACELRSPTPFTDESFRAFNESYVARLRTWGLVDGTVNPVARSNVCPEINPPSVPSFHAFGFTIEATHASPTFVIAGSGEAPEGSIGSYAERAVRSGETSADAIREKARFVLGEMERRLSALGFGWLDTTAVQIYTLLNIHPLLPNEIARRGAARSGVIWHYARPPLLGLEYEMDCAGIRLETVADPDGSPHQPHRGP